MIGMRSVVVIVVAVSILALVVASVVTGRDAPPHLATLLGTALGVALGTEYLNRKDGDDNND